MKNIHAMAGGSVGYVRGLASVRCGGVAFPLDLVRAVAKTAARLAVRRRVGAAFAGYLAECEEDGSLGSDKTAALESAWLDAVRKCAVDMGPGPYASGSAGVQ